jgi:hypothetical protein
MCSRGGLDVMSLPRIEHQFLGRPAHIPLLHRLRYPGSYAQIGFVLSFKVHNSTNFRQSSVSIYAFMFNFSSDNRGLWSLHNIYPKGRAMAQTVSRWLRTAAAQVRGQSGHMGFVVYEVALGQVFCKYFGFPFQSSFRQILHPHNHPGQVQYANLWLACRVHPVGLLPPLFEITVYPCRTMHIFYFSPQLYVNVMFVRC